MSVYVVRISVCVCVCVCVCVGVCIYIYIYICLHKQLIYFQNCLAVLSWLCQASIERRFLISSLSAGGITQCRWQYVAYELRFERACSAVQAASCLV